MSRLYTITLTLQATFDRRVKARSHGRRLSALLGARAAPWSVVRVSARSRPVIEREESPRVPFDPLRNVDPRLAEREWIAEVMRKEGLARWKVKLGSEGGRYGRCRYSKRMIILGGKLEAHLRAPDCAKPPEWPLVERWLVKQGVEATHTSPLRYVVLHEAAHALGNKRYKAARRRWSRGRTKWEPMSDNHGTRFRRAFLGLLRRHASEVFEPVEQAATPTGAAE